jgi:hypothetical protein
MRIKDFVSKRSGNIVGRLQRDLGLSLEVLDSQLQGNPEALKELGETARQADLINHFLPQVKEQWKSIITAQRDYNQAIGELISEGQKYGLTVTKAEAQAVLNETKYNHGISEIEAESIAQQLFENRRHENQMGFISMRAEIDNEFQEVEHQDRLKQQMVRPALKQMQEDTDYQYELGDHYLLHGEKSQPILINRKNYLGASQNPLMRIGQRLGIIR